MSQRAATPFRRSSAHRWALACALLVAACTTAETDAEIVIVVDTDFAVPDELDAVDFYVKRVGASDADAQTLPVRLGGKLGKKLPLRLGIAPDGKVKSAVDIVVTGYVGNPRTEVIRRKASLRFQPGKVLLLRMDLVKSCEPKYLACEAKQQTCDPRGCVPVDDVKTSPWNGDDNQGSPIDAQQEPDTDAGDESDTDAGDEPDEPVQLTMGARHSCVRTRRGRVFCWGLSGGGVLGDGQATHAQTCSVGGQMEDYSAEPVEVVDLPEARQISAGNNTTCAVHAKRPDSPGNVSCWGALPNDPDFSARPVAVTLDGERVANAAEVRVGERHSCIRRTDALPACWGFYSDGSLGNGNTTDYVEGLTVASRLEPVATPEQLVQLALGSRHSCARTSAGKVLCWGSNQFGQAGQPLDQPQVLDPAEVPGFDDVSELYASERRTYAVVDGAMWAFGNNTWSALGVPPADLKPCEDAASCTDVPKRVPTEQAGEGKVVQLAGGVFFGCVRLDSGRVGCWGNNETGALGPRIDSGVTVSDVPVSVLDGATDLAAGENHACAIVDDEVVCWGYNDCGQIGQTADSVPFSRRPMTVPLELD